MCRCFELSRNAARENDHLRGFVRFRELDNGILYAPIGPRNNLLTFLMEHFSDRLGPENFILYDKNRGFVGLHPAGKSWYLRRDTVDENSLVVSEKEKEYSALYKAFLESLAIESRENPKQQQNMLPLRFREYMTEWSNL